MGHNVCVELEDDLFIEFKETASTNEKFTRGYTSKALRKAVKMYILIDEVHPDMESLIKIAGENHPDLEKKDLIKLVFDECKELYLKENKEYL